MRAGCVFGAAGLSPHMVPQEHVEEYVCIYDLDLHDYWRFPQTSSSDPIILRDESQAPP